MSEKMPNPEELKKVQEENMSEEQIERSEEREATLDAGARLQREEEIKNLFDKFESQRERSIEATTSEEAVKIEHEISETVDKAKHLAKNKNTIEILKQLREALMGLSANGKRVHKYPNNPEWPKSVEFYDRGVSRLLKSLHDNFS